MPLETAKFQWFQAIRCYRHCLYSMWSRVYEMAELHLFMCLSVPSINSSSGGRLICCWAPSRQEISINSGGCLCRIPAACSLNSHTPQLCMHAGSVTLTAKIWGWTQTEISVKLQRFYLCKYFPLLQHYLAVVTYKSVTLLATCFQILYKMVLISC